jgi:hypothetical protein
VIALCLPVCNHTTLRHGVGARPHAYRKLGQRLGSNPDGGYRDGLIT